MVISDDNNTMIWAGVHPHPLPAHHGEEPARVLLRHQGERDSQPGPGRGKTTFYHLSLTDAQATSSDIAYMSDLAAVVSGRGAAVRARGGGGGQLRVPRLLGR